MDKLWEHVFQPGATAVVGASADPEKQGYRYVSHLLDCGFRGRVYPVNPNVRSVCGLPCLPSLRDAPGEVDYVISCIPAQGLLSLLDDCAAKKVRVLHSYTARLSETGRPEAAKLERAVLEKARSYGIRIVGPNCLGIYCPSSGLSFKYNFPREAGTVAFLSQSGGNASELVYRGSVRGLRFSKVISYGNALDLNEADFLEYLAGDPETRVVGAYIEGAKGGRRFLSALEEVSRAKPVAVLKGGRSAAGARAVSSHTASLAGQRAIWETALEQAGVTQVESLEELIDVLLAFRFLPSARGTRVGVAGGGGGLMVRSADECEAAGLQVVPLPQEIREQLRAEAPQVWDWLNNPADGSILGESGLSPARILELMAPSPAFDVLIANMGEEFFLDRPEGVRRLSEAVDDFLKAARATPKPVAFVLGPADVPEDWRWKAVVEARERITGAGFPVYPSVARAARALSLLAQHHQRHGR